MANEEIESKTEFKQFDVISGPVSSDHHFYTSKSNHTNEAAKKIIQEWKILEKNLPESIFVKVYENRIDLLRAVIVGSSGTPYHNGIFFFDFRFPSDYPSKPPEVHYHSYGLRLNPNLYATGYVCLSLLNTWYGKKDEKWVPSKSTILQVLVSIQGLVLNEEPYFNEPAFLLARGTQKRSKQSLAYNEEIFLLSCKTMLYVVSKPPEHFKEFVAEHFHDRSEAILKACKAYINGGRFNFNGLLRNGSSSSTAAEKKVSQRLKISMEKIYPKLESAFSKDKSSLGNSIEQVEEHVSSKPPPPPPPPQEEIVVKGCGFPNFGKLIECLGYKKVAKIEGEKK